MAQAIQAKSNVAERKLDNVIDAMRDVQTEGDLWVLAERLVALVPKGDDFGEVIDRATKEGVVGKLSANTLRLYRNTAQRWPKDKRVANMSFSAHRDAMVLPSIGEAAKMLNDLAKTKGGAGKVTVADVRQAVAIKQGKKPKGSRAGVGVTKAQAQYAHVLADLQDASGAAFIAAIPTNLSSDQLDKLHAGLNKVLGHVDRQRATVARKAKQVQAKRAADKQPAKQAPAKPKNGNGNGKPQVTSKSAPRKGDLRGL